MSHSKWVGLLAAAFLGLSACTVVQPPHRELPQLTGYDSIPGIEESEPLVVNEAMRAFLERHAPKRLSKHTRVMNLFEALKGRGGLGFEYSEEHTRTAVEAFEMASGNCMSFSTLFVAMAREAGLEARYQQVDVPDNWNPRAGVLVTNRHINALVVHRGNEYVVDLNRRLVPRNSKMSVISDTEAMAQFYNNLAIAALLEGELAVAYSYARTALFKSPRQSYLWSNLGVIYKRNQQLEAAQWAFSQALAITPGNQSAINNLVSTYAQQGKLAEAKNWRERYKRVLSKSPYYLYSQAFKALQAGDHVQAIALLKRAIRKKRSEHWFYFLLARSYHQAGEIDKSEEQFEQARATASIEDYRRFYQQPFDQLMTAPLRDAKDFLPHLNNL